MKRGSVAWDWDKGLGVVTHETQYFDSHAGRYRTRYFGVKLDGGEWESKDPRPVAANIAAYFASSSSD